ncbi:MAG TPA: YdeI/OmpD-associated family protein [Cyclobacteriaceae bacterium]|nr:YdeI/OmpD-associated family protein [Cyclobacteriaceae bacterium]
MSNSVKTFAPKSRNDWRNWLKKNHKKEDSVWLLYYKKKTNVTSLTWDDAVEEALCFGWIDSKRQPLDDEKFRQFFGKRKSTGTWSRINKNRVEKLIEAGLMAKAGLEVIEKAKENGSWSILDDVEELKTPDDLAKAFRKVKGSKKYFDSLTRSRKRLLLQWLVLAKREETRQKRINEIAVSAGKAQMPRQFQ